MSMRTDPLLELADLCRRFRVPASGRNPERSVIPHTGAPR